jgi:hypothetical protein
VHRYPSVFPPAPQTTRAFGRALPATKQNRAKALEWLEKQEAVGWGAFYEPLEALISEGVDTVVLLSDGCPSRGRYDRDFRLLAEFPKANRFGFLAINTVLVGSTGTDREFMESFAALTGGLFRQAGGGE